MLTLKRFITFFAPAASRRRKPMPLKLIRAALAALLLLCTPWEAQAQLIGGGIFGAPAASSAAFQLASITTTGAGKKPSGGGGGGTVTFDPARTSPNLTLAPGNLTLSNSSGLGAAASSLGTNGVTADGTYTVWFTGTGSITAYTTWIIVANAAFDPTTDPSTGSNSIVEYAGAGDIYGSGAGGTGAPFSSASTNFGIKIVISGGGTSRTVQFGVNNAFVGMPNTLPAGPIYFGAGTTDTAHITISSATWS